MHRQFNPAEGAIGCSPAFDKRQFKGHHRFNPYMAGIQRAPVSIYKTENTYEILVFAPGRNKENFKVGVKGEEITVSYKPTEDTSSLEWIRKEYSRGGFERSFMVDGTIDTENIIAKYEDGVLKLSLSIKAGSEPAKQEVIVN
jgi:HSP20 family protein